MRRKTEDRSETRKAVAVRAAVEVMWSELGPLGLTVRRIAAEAGTTSQSIYTYFGSVDHAVDAGISRAVDELHGFVMKLAESPAAGGLDGRLAVAVTWRDYCVAFPARYKMTQLGCSPMRSDTGQGVALADIRTRLAGLLDGTETGLETLGALNGLIEIYAQAVAATDNPDEIEAAGQRFLTVARSLLQSRA
jgi:AcrR family transcriptional regulator